METVGVTETPRKNQIETQNPETDCKTRPKTLLTQEQDQDQNVPKDSVTDLKKLLTPDRLSVPKSFKYPERYRSPTDAMMSPVTKGLLARNRKSGGVLLPPSINNMKEIRIADSGLFKNEASSIEC